MTMETIYSVRLRYLVENQAAVTGVRQLANETRNLGKEGFNARGILQALTGGVVGIFSLREASKALIGFNAEVQSAKIGLAAVIQGNLGGTWDAATASAGRLYDQFQKFSVMTPVTTQQIMEFGNGISAAVFGNGGNMKDFAEMTEQGVIAAKALGANAQYASLELSEMLQAT